ncbi:hypothetical protein PUN28_014917 [Cardiocondyla obscurior]|uniref:Uncharacterized protein n=1 Tax=Cardiocondyla obscurior TaxID=286306 RepID=A0AAW2EYN2_9HYME
MRANEACRIALKSPCFRKQTMSRITETANRCKVADRIVLRDSRPLVTYGGKSGDNIDSCEKSHRHICEIATSSMTARNDTCGEILFNSPAIDVNYWNIVVPSTARPFLPLTLRDRPSSVTKREMKATDIKPEMKNVKFKIIIKKKR